MAEYELKLCPFCGGKAKFVYEILHEMQEGAIVCQKCGARSPIFGDTYERRDCKERAIEAWNRRADNG